MNPTDAAEAVLLVGVAWTRGAASVLRVALGGDGVTATAVVVDDARSDGGVAAFAAVGTACSCCFEDGCAGGSPRPDVATGVDDVVVVPAFRSDVGEGSD